MKVFPGPLARVEPGQIGGIEDIGTAGRAFGADAGLQLREKYEIGPASAVSGARSVYGTGSATRNGVIRAASAMIDLPNRSVAVRAGGELALVLGPLVTCSDVSYMILQL